MAVAGIQININTEEFRSVRDQLARFFLPAGATNVMAAALRKAIVPARQRLKDISPVGPTGNLKRAVSSKVVQYKQDGVAVAIVGYKRAAAADSTSAAGGSVRSGPDRARHQYWLEFGTDQRPLRQSAKQRTYKRRSPTAPFTRTRNGRTETVRGKGVEHQVTELTPTYIASSFNRLGPFKIVTAPGDGRVQTEPAYPRAFFRKSKTPSVIPAMPAGGSRGIPPVQTAFTDTQGEMASILQRELSLSLAQAWAALRFRDGGTLEGQDTLSPA